MISSHQEASHGSKYYNPFDASTGDLSTPSLGGTHDARGGHPRAVSRGGGPRPRRLSRSQLAFSSSSHLVDLSAPSAQPRWLLPRGDQSLAPLDDCQRPSTLLASYWQLL